MTADTSSPDGSTRTRRGFLSALGSVAAGVAGVAAAEPAAAAVQRSRYCVPDRRMRRAFHHEVNVIANGEMPVTAVRQTAHPRAEYVNVVPGVTFTRPQYEEFLSLLRRVLRDRSLSLVGDGFTVTGPHTSCASWVLYGTLPDGTRLSLPSTGSHRWAPNGKCIRAEVEWLDADAVRPLLASLAGRASSP